MVAMEQCVQTHADPRQAHQHEEFREQDELLSFGALGHVGSNLKGNNKSHDVKGRFLSFSANRNRGPNSTRWGSISNLLQFEFEIAQNNPTERGIFSFEI